MKNLNGYTMENNMITVTDDAINVLRESKENKDQYIRMGILPGGCSGFQYILNLEDTFDEEDEVVTISDDLSILIDPFSAQYLDGITLDYQSTMMGQGFVFNNPNASGGCGCGSSFTV
jgi:iron-sulfur cluster assembly accessory protein